MSEKPHLRVTVSVEGDGRIRVWIDGKVDHFKTMDQALTFVYNHRGL